MKKYLVTCVLATGAFLSGCEDKTVNSTVATPVPIDVTRTPESPTATLETKKLGTLIDLYVSEPTVSHKAEVNEAFAKLDGEIAELQQRVANTTGQDRAEAEGKLTNLQTYRNAEAARFAAASVAAPLSQATPQEDADLRSGGEKVEDAARRAGNNLQDAAEKAGNSIQKGLDNAGDKIKDATDN